MTMSYPPPPATPGPRRPPAAPSLSARQKRGAFWAGFLALNLIDFGGSLILLAVLAGVALAFVSALIRLASTGEPGSPLGPEPRAFLDFLQQFDAPLWLGLLALAGLVILAAGVLVSAWVLSGHGVARPWAVTWSAVGLSLPALAVVGFVASIASQLSGTVAFFGSAPWWSPDGADLPGVDLVVGVTLAIAGLLITIAVVGILGWLLWWWMAHALRAPVTEPVEGP